MSHIILYSKANCLNCTAAKLLLDANKLDFQERIGGLAGLREWLKWKQEQST